ncbi:MAG: hypothetical protein B6D41_18070 [Chloroflexi bacterium UTCFX4]|jgi:diguanylate cyclase (GGDEF)-like protein/PAS domain S-box-containing protein|nr:MAG: hypothetical protein B6D41_18070 [Chloroflexi bacterium UTCFX4]
MSIAFSALAFLLGGIAGAGILFWWLGRQMPRAALFKDWNDGVIALDARNRIADVNAAALEMFDARAAQWLGQTADRVLPPALAALLQTRATRRAEIEIPAEAQRARCVNARYVSLSKHARHGGAFILLQDITEHKRSAQTLERMNRQLQTQAAEIQTLQTALQAQATRDPLTDLYNRRFFLELLDKELKFAARVRLPVSVIMLDLDHFQSLNDTHGRAAGDALLKALGDWLRAKTRRGDLICRYDGDKFLVAMSGAPMRAGLRRAQEWRDQCRALRVQHNDLTLQTTISLGAATAPARGATAENLIHAAESAMYAAKQAGRDCARGATEHSDASAQREMASAA